jgi:predicted ATP-dependent endonuclease of OLD family
LVGANNSGKTSAITALRYFLIKPKAFTAYDIPLACWTSIDKLGEAFKKAENEELHYKWKELLPSLDVWLKVSEGEIHYVAHLIPTLDWNPNEGIGVRLHLEPKNSDELLKAYLEAEKAACDTLKEAQKEKGQAEGDGTCEEFALWPKSLTDFLKKRVHFLTVNAYLLDPSQKAVPLVGMAQPQKLPGDVEPLDDNPFKGLIKIDEVPAHRGLSDYSEPRGDGDESDQYETGRRQLLTTQLRRYYGKHLDPLKAPESSDILALRAIHTAQVAFDERLKDYFKIPIGELEQLGYPGVANPRLLISTSLKPVEGLDHQSAVQYDVASTHDKGSAPYRLPEQYNGLGYQNLISMVFRLISFRDDWMKVGKAARTDEGKGERQVSPAPLHLVLLEEPEAHLHVQVQQVFIRKAYEVLRNHPDLQGESPLSTQLVVSTHSSHIAHEVDFSTLRYFRRHPARSFGESPTSTVINLSEVFGTPDETARFVSRYLQATHADLFFADGAIMVEGAAERMLVPHFIRNHYERLHSCYITLLEVGGSHAHRLQQLIEHLGITTLIITDIDAVDKSTKKKERPKKGSGLITANNVLKEWHPQEETIDKLLDIKEDDKEKLYDDCFAIRVAYQSQLNVAIDEKDNHTVVFPRTFEDALVLQNIEFFRNAEGVGLIKKFRDVAGMNKDISILHDALLKALGEVSKAEFALDILYSTEPASIKVPEYIHNGLVWLEDKLLQRQQEVLVTQSEDVETPEKGAK